MKLYKDDNKTEGKEAVLEVYKNCLFKHTDLVPGEMSISHKRGENKAMAQIFIEIITENFEGWKHRWKILDRSEFTVVNIEGTLKISEIVCKTKRTEENMDTEVSENSDLPW